MSNWYDPTLPIPVGDRNFQKILTFYLFECPVTIGKAGVSVRGISLERCGWRGRTLTSLLSRMKQTASGHLSYLAVPASADVGEAVRNEEAASTLSDPHFELIAFREDTRLGKTKTILYMIRNALAHGSFHVARTDRGSVYWFDSSKGGHVRARIRLREETLLAWMELIRSGPSAAGRAPKRKHAPAAMCGDA